MLWFWLILGLGLRRKEVSKLCFLNLLADLKSFAYFGEQLRNALCISCCWPSSSLPCRGCAVSSLLLAIIAAAALSHFWPMLLTLWTERHLFALIAIKPATAIISTSSHIAVENYIALLVVFQSPSARLRGRLPLAPGGPICFTDLVEWCLPISASALANLSKSRACDLRLLALRCTAGERVLAR